MNDKERIQELASGVLKLEYLCEQGERDDRKLEKHLKYIADLARDTVCGQYVPSDDDKTFI